MTTHTGNRPHKCKLCPETCISKAILNRHMRFHGIYTRIWRCEHCSKELANMSSLHQHVRAVHKQITQCVLCKIDFSSRDELKHHMDTAHEPFVCEVCNKTFSLPRYLRMHQKIHFDSNDQRLQCPFCQKCLMPKRIKSHVFRSHPVEFPEWHEQNPLFIWVTETM